MTSDAPSIDLDDLWGQITPCVAHEQDARYIEDCEHCLHEKAERDAIIENLNESAMRSQRALMKSGVQVPPSLLLQVRLELLIDAIMGTDRSRAQFEGECGRRMLNEMREAQRTILAHPPIHMPNGRGGLHVPKG
jgi:hypothetical protein